MTTGTTTTRAPRAHKVTRKEYQVHGMYAGQWEEVTAEDSRAEALQRLKEYRENERGTAFRLIVKRERVEAPPLERLTIYDIRRRVEEGGESPYFFARKSMRFFGQTLRNFSVVRNFERGTYTISAPMIDRSTGRRMGTTCREFDPRTNKLNPVQS